MASVLGMVGCGRDEIRTYEVPKSQAKTETPAAPTTGEFRILGAMYPPEEPTWFFKIVGPSAAIEPHLKSFDDFLASLRFPDPKGPPAYDLPAGWASTGPKSIHADTIAIGTGPQALELTITPAMGGVNSNLKRWAVDQLGMPASVMSNTAQFSKTVPTKGGAKVLRVDLTGPNNPAGSRPRMMGGK